MFRKNIEKNCTYCMYGEKLKSNDDILCSKFGITVARYNCRSFRYAPLKRVPEEKHSFGYEYSGSEFMINGSEKHKD